MAINEALPGVEITITVAGQPLQEYTEADVDEEPGTVTRYIEATSGQVFEIKVKVDRNAVLKGSHLEFQFYVDGKWIDGVLENRVHRPYSCKGCEIASGVMRLCRFDVLETGMWKPHLRVDLIKPFSGANRCPVADGKLYGHEARKIEKVGTIEVHVLHVNLLGKTAARFEEVEETGIVSEKGLMGRALSHSVGYATSSVPSIQD